jgi:hypothetical protein
VLFSADILGVCEPLCSFTRLNEDSHFQLSPPLPNPSFLFLGSEDFQSLKDTMTAGFSSIRLDMNMNREFFTFSPSEACESKNGGGGSKFSSMCDVLGIDQLADDSKPIFTSDKFPLLKFSWKSNGKKDDIDELATGANADEKFDGFALTATNELGAEEKEDDDVQEKASYQPTMAYLVENDLHAYDISGGSGCTNKFLFDVAIHSVRKQLKSLSHLPSNVIRLGNLRGRSDLVVLFKKAHGDILRHQVRFLIEIKTVSAMAQQAKADACDREAFTQTVGMNLANPHTSPPVILTNLSGKHKVFYLESAQETQRDPRKYTLFVQKCDSFSSAVAFAYSRSAGHSEANSMIDFGRGPTPPASITDDDVGEERRGSREFEELKSDEQDLEGFA